MDMYDKLLLWAVGAGIFTMLLCMLIRKTPKRQWLVLLPGMALSLMLGYAVSICVDVMIIPYFEFADVRLFPPNCGNQYLITMLAFYGFYALYTLIVRQPFGKSMDLPLLPIVVFSLVGRFACVWAGCCKGIPILFDYAFPCVWLEIIFAAIFLFLSVIKSRGSAYRYLQAYCIFRVVMELFRMPTGVETFYNITVNIIVALFVGAGLILANSIMQMQKRKFGFVQQTAVRR